MGWTGSMPPFIKDDPEEHRVFSHTYDNPPFPTYSTEVNRPYQLSGTPSYGPGDDHRYLYGPVPAPGTPQDRFAAVLGRSSQAARMPDSSLMGANGMAMQYPNPPHIRDATWQPAGGFQVAQTGPLTRPASYNLPNKSSSYQYARRNESRSQGGRGPAMPNAQSPMTQWLSFECQRRKFNPETVVVEDPDNGSFKCNITVKGILVEGGRSFGNFEDARMHAASQALKVVQKWPLSGPMGAEAARRGIKSPHIANDRQVNDLTRRQEQLRAKLIENKQERKGKVEDTKPAAGSDVGIGNPVEALAFFEGFKMGQLKASKDGDGPTSSSASENASRVKRSHTRSRSPSQRFDHRYRHRSPVQARSDLLKREAYSPRRISCPRHHDRGSGRSSGRRETSKRPIDRYRPGEKHKMEQDLMYGRL